MSEKGKKNISNHIRDLIKKLRKDKEEKVEIPTNYVQCTRCLNWVPKHKAVVSLPEDFWVCDECYFGPAHLVSSEVEARIKVLRNQLYESRRKAENKTLCEVCGVTLSDIWCTRNVCKTCCKEGYCSMRYKCKAWHPNGTLKATDYNPSRR